MWLIHVQTGAEQRLLLAVKGYCYSITISGFGIERSQTFRDKHGKLALSVL